MWRGCGPERLVVEGLGDLDLGHQLGGEELAFLEGPTGCPNALRSLMQTRVSSRIWAAWARLPTAMDSRPGKPAHQVDEALVEVTGQVVARDADDLEEQLRGVRHVLTDLVQRAVPREAVHAGATANSDMPFAVSSGELRAATTTRSTE